MENECIAEISNVTEFYNVLGNDAEETGRLFIKNVLTTIFIILIVTSTFIAQF